MAYVRQHPNYPLFRIKKGVMPDFSGANYSDQEPLTGFDGAKRQFQLNHLPLKHSEEVFKDGLKMTRASTLGMTDGDYFIDYTEGKITFSDKQIPQVKSVAHVSYKYMRSA